MYKIIGPFIAGIELIKLPHSDDYRPYFVVYPLWEKSLEDCLDAPSIYYAVLDQKGQHYDIPYLKHEKLFFDAVNCATAQLPFNLNRDISLKEVEKVVLMCAENRAINPRGSAGEAFLLEFLLFSTLYAGGKTTKVINKIEKRKKHWNMTHFEYWHGDFADWLEKLIDVTKERDSFMEQIVNNKMEKKFRKLQFSELIL